MSRTISLIIYKSPFFPAHWAMWVPSEANQDIGKRIHIEGDVANGFKLSFNRNYNIKEDSRKKEVLRLAEVGADLIADTPGNGLDSVDTESKDEVERVAADVPPPGPSLVSAATRNRGTKVEIRNCQTWLTEVVGKLHEEGIFDSNAVIVVNAAPKN
ncbi:hypothetical protein GGR51DRAFT_72408 [Nemania sp. FL0031]|nr:hypothetical protein GGR51DRAFT_72408 [Nemania sp. FL0031]